MRHRIFIAINLPENLKKELASYQSKWPELPARWVKPENLHITLLFLGYLSDEELVEVIKITKEAAARHPSFSLNLNKILYGPPHQNSEGPRPFTKGRGHGAGRFGAGQAPKKPPRMIWAEGKKSKELALLKDDLEKSLTELAQGAGEGQDERSSSPTELPKEAKFSSPKDSIPANFSSENRAFSPHITLSRIITWQWRQIEPEERPGVDEEINLRLEVNSIEVMESQLKRTGPDYIILESCPLTPLEISH